MGELPETPLLPVLAAMAAMDEVVANQKLLAERLAGAVEAAEHLDEDLRRVDPAQHDALVGVAQKLARAVTHVQRLATLEERARLAVRQAQQRLDEARRTGHGHQLERLRVELEIDAASIWDLVGQFEAQVRERLGQHAALAADLAFTAQAAGEPQQLSLPAVATWVPALGTSGPDLLDALANGVRQLQGQRIAGGPDPAGLQRLTPDHTDGGVKTVAGTRMDREPEIVRPSRVVVETAAAVESPAPPAPQITPRGRLERALNALGRAIDSKAPPAKKSSR